MPTRDEQAMGVLCAPRLAAIAYLGEAEHPLNDPDRMLLYTAISCTVFRGKVNLTAEHHKSREETYHGLPTIAIHLPDALALSGLMLGTRHAAGFSPHQGGHPVPGSLMNQRRWVAPSSAPRRRDKRCLYPARLALRRALAAPGSRPRRLYLRGDGTLGADGPGGPPRG